MARWIWSQSHNWLQPLWSQSRSRNDLQLSIFVFVWPKVDLIFIHNFRNKIKHLSKEPKNTQVSVCLSDNQVKGELHEFPLPISDSVLFHGK